MRVMDDRDADLNVLDGVVLLDSELTITGIPRHNNYTHIRIQTSDNVGWDLLKFCVVFTIFDNFLAINFTNPNIRPGFSCLS